MKSIFKAFKKLIVKKYIASILHTKKEFKNKNLNT